MAAPVTAALRRGLAAVLVWLVCAALAGCDWPRHDMADQPSPATGQGPRSSPEGARPLSEGARMASDPAAVANGRRLYATYCTPCHGSSGTGDDAAVAKFFPRVGDLTSFDVQHHGDGWLYAVIADGTQAMPAYRHELDVHERWQIVRFVRTLAR